jgi:hypothetical protein
VELLTGRTIFVLWRASDQWASGFYNTQYAGLAQKDGWVVCSWAGELLTRHIGLE